MTTETKVFDPAGGFAPLTDPVEVTDPTLVKRGNRWWMYVATEVADRPGIQLASASLPDGAPLSATGWTLMPDRNDPRKIGVLPQEHSQPWDLAGGRHCPSYVKGWDPHSQRWVERLYYAGAAEHLWGPYAIGYLEWNGGRWVDQAAPVFEAIEAWERGSVYEPNLIYADGKWKLWYVAGANQDDYLVHGFAESEDGRTGWTAHQLFIPADQRVFDFRVIPVDRGYEAIFSRVCVRGTPPATAGLWWCRCDTLSADIADWSEPLQIMTAEDRGWHVGPWKPSAHYGDTNPDRLFVFFSGLYSRNDGSPFPFTFTLGCLELDRPGVI
jgi:hypothetical protein